MVQGLCWLFVSLKYPDQAMSTICCENSQCEPSGNGNKHPCPANGKTGVAVSTQTLLQHIKMPWRQSLQAKQFYFCDSTDCDIVYFAADNSVFTLEQVRSPIGQKQTGSEKLICYCFGISAAQASHDPACKRFVVEQTRSGNCACESRNPSGRCCLKDFPKGG